MEEVRQQLLNQAAERNDLGELIPGEPSNGRPTVKIAEATREGFESEIKQLLETEFKVGNALTEDDIAGISIAPATLLQLGGLLAT